MRRSVPLPTHRTPFVVVGGLAAFVLGALSASCGRATPPVAPIDIVVRDLEGGAELAVEDASSEAPPAARCSARLLASTIRTNSGCVLDERISASTGELSFPCRGDGPADAVFDDHRFEGLVTDGKLSLALRTELDWEDGCRWETRQSMGGDLERGEEKISGSLSWTYAESTVSGTGCGVPCRATARVRVLDESDDTSMDDDAP